MCSSLAGQLQHTVQTRNHRAAITFSWPGHGFGRRHWGSKLVTNSWRSSPMPSCSCCSSEAHFRTSAASHDRSIACLVQESCTLAECLGPSARFSACAPVLRPAKTRRGLLELLFVLDFLSTASQEGHTLPEVDRSHQKFEAKQHVHHVPTPDANFSQQLKMVMLKRREIAWDLLTLRTFKQTVIFDLLTDKQTDVPSDTSRESEQLRAACSRYVNPCRKTGNSSSEHAQSKRIFPREATCARDTFWDVRISRLPAKFCVNSHEGQDTWLGVVVERTMCERSFCTTVVRRAFAATLRTPHTAVDASPILSEHGHCTSVALEPPSSSK